MNRCPITYEPCRGLYSRKGLVLLSRQLKGLQKLPFSSQELRLEAAARAGKMSIQGVQPNLSALLLIKEQRFDLVDLHGKYILKPQLPDHPEVPENEDLTMRLASFAGIEIPLHGLLYGRDGNMTYFIRRFDRRGHKGKLHVEDFAQLDNKTRDTKYRASMEQVARLVETYCTFPVLEKLKLFRLTLFCFLVGNEDMHLKNLSIIRINDVITLSPAYDLLNTTIIIQQPKEELALPLNGKKNNLKRQDLINYFGKERLALPEKAIQKVLDTFSRLQTKWNGLIDISFLTPETKEKYRRILADRSSRILE